MPDPTVAAPAAAPAPESAPVPAHVPAPGAPTRCGTVALVGRPNVGKSTLLNALVGQKISITSKKPQTTRHRIAGVLTRGAAQFVFVDTPGLQRGGGDAPAAGAGPARAALARSMNRTVRGVLADVDVVLVLVEAGRFTDADARVVASLPGDRPAILVANKLDAIPGRRQDLLPWLAETAARHAFAEVVPLSARRAADVERLAAIVEPHLPEGPWRHDADALTDRSDRFLAAELVREKLFRLTGDELPYGATVLVDRYDEPAAPGGLRRIAATIVVERDAHKAIVIGEGGLRIKRIGSEARQDLERLTGDRVHLELWVKVRSGWAASDEHLRSFGYE